jgi:uncharacterized protein YqeY
MRSGDETRKLAIRSVKTAWRGRSRGRERVLTDQDVLGIIARQIKQRRDSAVSCQGGGLTWLQRRGEMAVLQAIAEQPDDAAIRQRRGSHRGPSDRLAWPGDEATIRRVASRRMGRP